MKTKNLRWGESRLIRPERKRFGTLLDKSDGGRGLAAYNQAGERAKMSVEGASSGCVKYSPSGLAIPCNQSEKKLGS